MKKIYVLFAVMLMAAAGLTANARPVNFNVDRADAVGIGQYSTATEKIELDKTLQQGDNEMELSGYWYLGALDGYEIVSVYDELTEEFETPYQYDTRYYSFYYGKATSHVTYTIITKIAGEGGGGDTPVEPVKNEVNFKLSAGKAELWVYNPALQDYEIAQPLNDGDNKVDVDKSTYYRIQAADGYRLDEVLANGTKLTIQENTFICPVNYVVVDGATATGEYTITASEKPEAAGTKVNFYLMPGSEASVCHYVFADDEYVFDKNLEQGNNEIVLAENLPYYIIAGKGLKFESILDHEDKTPEIYFDKDFEDGRYVAIVPVNAASSEYVITTVDAGTAPVTGETDFILAEGSKAAIYVEGFIEPELLVVLEEGSNRIELETAINRYYIVPADGYRLAKVLDADKKELTLSENPEMFPTNYLSVNDNLSASYEIYTAGTDAIDTIVSDADTSVAYFDLQGRRVSCPAQGGVYIRVADGIASKIVK